MGLLFKVRPKRCDSQCLVQTSQETRDSKERKKCKETRIIHSRDKLDQIIPHFKKLKRFKLFIGFPRDPGARVSEDQNPIQPQFTIFSNFFPEEHEFLDSASWISTIEEAPTTTVPTYIFKIAQASQIQFFGHIRATNRSWNILDTIDSVEQLVLMRPKSQ